LESQNIVHRDLKCENLFLDTYYNLKIGDFGFARYLQNGDTSNTFCGSKAYVALEIMQSVEYTSNAIDIWSAGVILYIMLTGKNYYV
jgi:serine kinase